MVHGALIEAGKVEKLTFKQLRALERIDAKKARDLKVLELTYPAWLPPVEAAAQALAGAIGQAFKSGATGPSAPVIDLSGGTGNFGIHITPQQWVAVINSIVPFGGIVPGSTLWFETAQARDQQFSKMQSDGSLNWYWAFTKVNR